MWHAREANSISECHLGCSLIGWFRLIEVEEWLRRVAGVVWKEITPTNNIRN